MLLMVVYLAVKRIGDGVEDAAALKVMAQMRLTFSPSPGRGEEVVAC